MIDTEDEACAASVGGRARPSTGGVGSALHMVGRSWAVGPGRFDADGRLHRRSGGGLELHETGLGTIGRRAGFVRDGLARADGFPLKMRERAREPWLAHLK